MHEAWVLFSSHVQWMGWNLFLAFLPLAIGVWLFRTERRRTVGWWVALAIFVALLPNAPYVMSDLIHLPGDVRAAPSMKVTVFGLLPLYGFYVLAGLEAYVLSVRLVRRSLGRTGGRALVVLVDIGAALCAAVGIFLGRIDRLNSWDPLLEPHKVWTALGTVPNHLTLIVTTATVVLSAATAVWLADLFALRATRWVASRLRLRLH